MRIPRRSLLVLAVMAGAAMTLLIPTAASAAYYGTETNYASEIPHLPDDDAHHHYTSSTGVAATFKFYGDSFYVRDTKADGYSAVVEWFDDDSNRSGACVNKHGANTWGYCNKNFTEGHTIWFRAARYNNGNPVDGGPWVQQIA